MAHASSLQQSTKAPTVQYESRWPVIAVIVAVIVMLMLLPDRIRLTPTWLTVLAGLIVVTPTAFVGLTRHRLIWLKIERVVVVIFFLYSVVGMFGNLVYIMYEMVVHSSEVGGLDLLAAGISVWVINVLMFSLFYWQMDGGGPERRVHTAANESRPDFVFSQMQAPTELSPVGWRPLFVDYLFLGYNTASAFSPTSELPMTSRAKLLMMLQSIISLATVMIVAARAVNILG